MIFGFSASKLKTAVKLKSSKIVLTSVIIRRKYKQECEGVAYIHGVLVMFARDETSCFIATNVYLKTLLSSIMRKFEIIYFNR